MIFCLNKFPTQIFSKLKNCQKHRKNEKNNTYEYLSMLDYKLGQPYESTQQI